MEANIIDIAMNTLYNLGVGTAANAIYNRISNLTPIKNKENNEISTTEQKIRKEIIIKYEEYLKETIVNLYQVKTFLFDTNTISFRDIYYPINIKCRKKNIDNLENIEDIIKIDDNINNLFSLNKRIAIIGVVGSGKTMITKQIFLASLLAKKLLPLRIQFRDIIKNQTIDDYIKSNIFKLNHITEDEKEIYNEILNSGQFLFILDGFDETKRASFEFTRNDIKNFTNKYNKNFFVLTSRTDVGIEYFDSYDTYDICGLNDDDIFPFIKLQCKYIYKGLNIYKSIEEKLTNNKEKEAYIKYFKNPLFLTLFIFTFQEHPDIPTQKSEFYGNVFDALYRRHDAKKGGGYTHEKYYPDRSSYEKVLSYFSFITYFKEDYIFNEDELLDTLEKAIIKAELYPKVTKNEMKDDLVTSISIFFNDGDYYSFPHRTMQDYFIAVLIKRSMENKKIEFYDFMRQHNSYLSDHNYLLELLYEIDYYGFIAFYIKQIFKNYYNNLTKYTQKYKLQKKLLKKNTKINEYIKETKYLSLETSKVYNNSISFILSEFDRNDQNEIHSIFVDNYNEIFNKTPGNISLSSFDKYKKYFDDMSKLSIKINQHINDKIKHEENRYSLKNFLENLHS